MALSRNVQLLALASLLADVSGEMLMALFPFLLVATGATGIGLGLAGGAADAVGHLVKPFAGALADRTRIGRKPLILGGYLTAALSRIGIALATWWPLAVLFRATDRVGKGLRTGPRDSLLAESAPREERGRAFGVHRAADTTGAILGVGAALAMVALLGASAQQVILVGAFVGLLTLVPLTFVRDKGELGAGAKPIFEATSPRYRSFLVVAGVFALGQVSYLFFLLRAARTGSLGETGAIALYLLFNLVYALVAYPAGWIGDRVPRPRLLAAGFACFAGSSALLALAPHLALASFVLLGVAFGLVDGTERAYAADLAGSAARSTRLGIFHAVVGVCAVAGGLVAGALWDFVGEPAAFAWGAAVPLVALALLVALGFVRR